MTNVVLYSVPRYTGWQHLVPAICAHLHVPVSSECWWTDGVGDIRIDLGDTSEHAAVYLVELYTLTLGVEYRILSGPHIARCPQTSTQAR